MSTKSFLDDRFYSTTELIELGQKDLFPVKTLTTLNKLINKKRIQSMNIGSKKRKVYRIKGEWVNDFIFENEKR